MRWCFENCINAKSMRSACDVFAEIRQTFRSELDVTIPIQFARHGRSAANQQMARVLFECYRSNLSRFTGHERAGYVPAKVSSGGDAMYVHPSSALTYIEQLPTWIVYEQVSIVVGKNVRICHYYYYYYFFSPPAQSL